RERQPEGLPAKTTSRPPKTAWASQLPPNGRPARATSRAPSGVRPRASAPSGPSAIAPYMLGRRAAWKARPRSTASAGRLCSAATWSARGAGAGAHGTRTAATTTTPTTSSPRATAAHTRGLMPIAPRRHAKCPALGRRPAAPGGTDQAQAGPGLVAGEDRHLEPGVGEHPQRPPLLVRTAGDGRCLAGQHADHAVGAGATPDGAAVAGDYPRPPF